MQYERVTKPNGQGMSWPIWTIGWLDLDDFTDKSEADRSHERSYLHIQPPFLLFTDYVEKIFSDENISEGKILLLSQPNLKLL